MNIAANPRVLSAPAAHTYNLAVPVFVASLPCSFQREVFFQGVVVARQVFDIDSHSESPFRRASLVLSADYSTVLTLLTAKAGGFLDH
jgi:hypothetical protein